MRCNITWFCSLCCLLALAMALPVAAAAATAPVQVADVLIPGSVLVFPLFEKGTVTNAGFFQNLAWSTTRSLWASTSTTRLTSLSSADGPSPRCRP